MSEQAGRYQRTFSGMIGAMLVLVVVVLGYAGLRALTRDNPATPVLAVDYKTVLTGARAHAAFPVLAPPRLRSGWKATSVSFTPKPDEHWHLGCLTDVGRYVGIEQGNQSAGDLLGRYVAAGRVRGPAVTVHGRGWTTYTAGDGDRAMVAKVGGSTVLVVGHDVPKSELTGFVASLR